MSAEKTSCEGLTGGGQDGVYGLLFGFGPSNAELVFGQYDITADPIFQ